SLAAALRCALPPGMETSRYRIIRPSTGWKWKAGDFAGRSDLKRLLGEEGFRIAERDERIELSPRLPAVRTEEWAGVENGTEPDFGRARRQRELFEFLRERGGEMPVSKLLSETNVSRGVLRSLAGRGAVSLETRLRNPIVTSTGEDESTNKEFVDGVTSALESGDAWLWRVPSREFSEAVCAMAREAIALEVKLLVLAPEVKMVNGLVENLRRNLASGARIAAYHGDVGRDRAEVWRLAKAGEIDVLVGTRTAALVPLKDVGVLGVVDEPNEAHRAAPGYEGLPIHIRDIVLERGRLEDSAVLFLSPTPSLRLYALAKKEISEVPARGARNWPSVRLVDMRGSGAALSSTAVSACREALVSGENVGVVVGRLGYATAVSCGRCGSVRACPN
ncbi:MAG: hypothetical protein ACRDSJ_20275, partial [Rubrobacteraceae bacterium]